MAPRDGSINKGKHAYKQMSCKMCLIGTIQNSSEVIGVNPYQRCDNKHLGAMHLSGLLSHLWLGSHQQPPRNFALFLKQFSAKTKMGAVLFLHFSAKTKTKNGGNF